MILVVNIQQWSSLCMLMIQCYILTLEQHLRKYFPLIDVLRVITVLKIASRPATNDQKRGKKQKNIMIIQNPKWYLYI